MQEARKVGGKEFSVWLLFLLFELMRRPPPLFFTSSCSVGRRKEGLFVAVLINTWIGEGLMVNKNTTMLSSHTIPYTYIIMSHDECVRVKALVYRHGERLLVDFHQRVYPPGNVS